MLAAAAFVRQGFRHMTAYRVEALMSLVGNFTMLGLYMAIWSAVLGEDPAARGRMLEYTFVSQFLVQWHFLPMWEVEVRFRQGDVALELVKPVPMPVRFLADFFGRVLFRLLMAFPAYGLLAPLLGVLHWPGWGTLGLFVLSAVLGWIVNATLRFCVEAVALWTTQFDQAEHILQVLMGLFSGTFLPLWYLPRAVAQVVAYLPFPGVFYVPAAIYTGGLTGGAARAALAVQAAWAAAGILLLAAIWRAGTRKLSVMGG